MGQRFDMIGRKFNGSRRLDRISTASPGYARVSTREQDLTIQREALRAAGCTKIYAEKMSGIPSDRPQLPDSSMRWNRVIRHCNGARSASQIEARPAKHDRQAWPEWLGEEFADTMRLKALLALYPSEGVICWPVSARVGNVKNNDPSLIEPIAANEPA